MKSAAYDSFDIVQMLFAPPRRFIVGFLRVVVGPFAEESSLGGGALGLLNAPLCAPLWRLNLCASPPAVPTKAKFPHALTATHRTAAPFLSAAPPRPILAGGARTCSPRTPSFSRHVYALGWSPS